MSDIDEITVPTTCIFDDLQDCIGCMICTGQDGIEDD